MRKSLLVVMFLAGCMMNAQSQKAASRKQYTHPVAIYQSDGSSRRVSLDIRNLELDAEGDFRDIDVPSFCVLSLSSGRLEVMSNDKAITRNPGEFWSKKPGDKLRVRVLSESAVLQIISIAPQQINNP